jgi:hypothetical protein
MDLRPLDRDGGGGTYPDARHAGDAGVLLDLKVHGTADRGAAAF